MIDNIEFQKHFFRPVCNEQEIERVFNVKDANDYLLKLRAETIVDHMRLFRVYRNKALMDQNNWSLESSFDRSHYDAFLHHLPPQDQERCRATTHGNIFSNDPNGSIFATDYGPIITISDSLRFFLKFMHLALLDFGGTVPTHVRLNAMRIAIRVMLKTESLDFLMDPRGIVPRNIGEAMHAPIPYQLRFIAGHEFAHHLLGHLSEANVESKPIYFAISKNDQDYKPMKVYSGRQKDELDADIRSLALPHYETNESKLVLETALVWFGCLELYEAACEAICPKGPWTYETHPSARERFENLLTNAPASSSVELEHWRGFTATIDHLKKVLLEDVSLKAEVYETYGSFYLDKPDTEWRGPKLIDRVDYY
jgi:hypothetical protein